jgi:hypothetical protein
VIPMLHIWPQRYKQLNYLRAFAWLRCHGVRVVMDWGHWARFPLPVRAGSVWY